MSEREKYLKLTGEMNSLASKIAGLREELIRLQTEHDPAENELLKSELRGDADAPIKRAAFDKAVRRRDQVDIEIADGRKRMRAFQEVIVELRAKAAEEINANAEREFAKVLRSFVEKIRAAKDAEEALEASRVAWHSQLSAIAAQPPKVDFWAPVLMRNRAPFNNNPMNWEKLFEIFKRLGFDV